MLLSTQPRNQRSGDGVAAVKRDNRDRALYHALVLRQSRLFSLFPYATASAQAQTHDRALVCYSNKVHGATGIGRDTIRLVAPCVLRCARTPSIIAPHSLGENDPSNPAGMRDTRKRHLRKVSPLAESENAGGIDGLHWPGLCDERTMQQRLGRKNAKPSRLHTGQELA